MRGTIAGLNREQLRHIARGFLTMPPVRDADRAG
jgi:hypothetical protein